MGNVQDTESEYKPPDLPPKPAAQFSPSSAVYPNLNNGDHDYEILNPDYNNRPGRPAPARPAPLVPQQSTHTLTSSHNGIEGVPFVINPRFLNSNNSDRVSFFRM